MARTDIVVFTRDLRTRDHPALAAAAAGADQVVPLFVLDRHLLAHTAHGRPNRLGFVLESLVDLDRSLTDLGAGLVMRAGDWVDEVAGMAATVGAGAIHVSDDVSAYAGTRLAALEQVGRDQGRAVHRHPGITVVPPEAIAPSSRPVDPARSARDREMKVFTPYLRRWRAVPWRVPVPRPRSLSLPTGLDRGAIPALAELTAEERSPAVVPGGEQAGLARLKAWARAGLAGYEDHHDDLPGDGTSRLSAYLHAGCLSPLEVASRLGDRPGGEAFIRQLCWRDFFHQVLAARPDAAHADYRPRNDRPGSDRPGRDRWHDDDDAVTAWKDGRTGFPIVDAGLRQLAREGFMHNRARMIVASFLTKDLLIDWRIGAAHFMDLLVDGDVASNQLNWQWVAGTGNDTNAFRVLSPHRQAERFDPDGDYVRRYVDELAGIAGSAVHDPPAVERLRVGYPPPIVDHAEAVAAYRARR